MKILHGMSEVAGQGIYSVLGLRANGVIANMAVWAKNTSNYPVDIDIKIDKKKKYLLPYYGIKMLAFALKALKKYDVLHSHYGYSLLPFNLDVPFVKKAGKKIFAEFHGSDLRFIFNDIQYDFFCSEEIEDKQRKRVQRNISKLLSHADGIVLHDIELIPHLPKTDLPIYIVPLRVDLSKFMPAFPDKKKKRPVIVHAPSNRRTKGTDKILEALSHVKGEYELVLVEGKTQQEAVELYRSADIIIDQVSLGTYGVFAIEAMALGKPVITYVSEEMRASFPANLPIVSCDVDHLTGTLEDLISDGQRRYDLGVQGRAYAERFHDNIKVTKYLAQIYEGTIENKNIFKLL